LGCRVNDSARVNVLLVDIQVGVALWGKKRSLGRQFAVCRIQKTTKEGGSIFNRWRGRWGRGVATAEAGLQRAVRLVGLHLGPGVGQDAGLTAEG
jgi:hypothetical protein